MTTFNLSQRKPDPKLWILLIFLLLNIVGIKLGKAQCGYAAGLGCSQTDYNNFGYSSSNNAATIEYDNYISGYHQTVARTFSGSFQIWGENTADDGVSSVLSPQNIDAANYPALTGTILKATIGSNGESGHQVIVLTTTGLFAGGTVGVVLHSDITNTSAFSKLTIQGRTNGMPLNVAPTDVKMLFATNKTLALVTCSGDVWVLTQTSAMRGNNSNGNQKAWYRVITSTDEADRLADIVAVRGSSAAMIALKRDGTVWTWGTETYLGDGSAKAKYVYARQMTLPKAGNVKMIGATSDLNSSFYLLYTDGSLYSLGNNSKRQLGDWTTTERTSWVQPRYISSSGPVMNNIRWMSPAEHDVAYPSVNVINNDMDLYNWGYEESYSLGRGNQNAAAVNPGMPAGLDGTQDIVTVETGGHTTMFTAKCHDQFGYIGHKINGSTGDGSNDEDYIASADFNTASVAICGANNTVSLRSWPASNGDDVCDASKILLDPSPGGGILSVLSGPGVINGNELTFSGTGQVEVQYMATAECGEQTVIRVFDVQSCELFKIKGMVWKDDNEDAVKDGVESSTNGGTRLTNGLWVNLVDNNGLVVQSIPVNLNGNYELSTTVSGDYSVQITNEQIGDQTSISPASRALPATWGYTGHNDGTPCTMPACSDPDIIAGITLNSANPEVAGLDFGIKEASLMPVELTSFLGQKKNNVTILTWATATESDNKGFEIQRSHNGVQWAKIGFVDSKSGNGYSNIQLNYQFTDASPSNGINYYRLKQVGSHDRFVFSKTVAVQFPNTSVNVAIYPNPAKDIVNIKELAGNETIMVLDNNGRQLFIRRAKNPTEKIDISPFPAGVYQITITNSDGDSKAFSVLKRP